MHNHVAHATWFSRELLNFRTEKVLSVQTMKKKSKSNANGGGGTAYAGKLVLPCSILCLVAAAALWRLLGDREGENCRHLELHPAPSSKILILRIKACA